MSLIGAGGRARYPNLLANEEDEREREPPHRAGWCVEVLQAAVERIPTAACVVSGTRVIAANQQALKRLAENPVAFWRDARREVPRSTEGGTSRPTGAASCEERWTLLVSERADDRVGQQVAKACWRWGLTARQAEVLTLLVEGETNRSIALRLGCADRTVDVHVSAMLQKSRCETRSALVSAFWLLS